jgi:hypothetical protein
MDRDCTEIDFFCVFGDVHFGPGKHRRSKGKEQSVGREGGREGQTVVGEELPPAPTLIVDGHGQLAGNSLAVVDWLKNG